MNIIDQEKQHTSGVYGKREVAIMRGAGAMLWDEQGRPYIDCVSGIGVSNVGHSHPAVVQAIANQAQTLLTCPEMFYNDRRAELLARLADVTPDGMERFFLCNSGTEAVEGAIKFARFGTGRTGVVAAMRGFHGRSLGALSATHKAAYRNPFLPLVPDFSHVPFNNIERLETAVTANTAAVILEVVQGEGGVRVGDRAYFQAARRLCDETGALLILDEVQTGYGRTGRMFACEYFGIEPDLLCLGKGIAGGMPMGAIGIGPGAAALPPGIHGSTFGGNPLACAAALAVLDVMAEEHLPARAAELGVYFRDRLQAIDSPFIREVRGLGLMVGVELKVRAKPIVNALMESGVLALTAGTTVIRLLPPLVISRDDLDSVVDALAMTLSQFTPESAQTGGCHVPESA